MDDDLLAAVAEFREREKAQGDLFGGPASGDTRQVGRPPGARNRRTDQAARIYMGEYGDPLKRGIEIAAMPILAEGVLSGLARQLGMSRPDAAKWWAGILTATLPYIHSRQASLTIKPDGAPDGDPADLEWATALSDLSKLTEPLMIEAEAEAEAEGDGQRLNALMLLAEGEDDP